MRAFLTIGLCLSALAAPIYAQQKKDGEKPRAEARAIVENLQTDLNTESFRNPLKFSEFLDLVHQLLHKGGKDIAIVVDEEAYRDDSSDAPAMLDQVIHLRSLPAKASVEYLLRQALKQLPVKSAFVVRAGKLDVVPMSRTSKEFMLNQTFHVNFSERPLGLALDELSEMTGVSIIVDGRAKQKVQTAVTARFHDDVALQDAVRMLADMADLKLVYLVTGIYVTTPEHAREMQKELRELYEPKVPTSPGVGVPGAAPPSESIERSPLAPPLPPTKRKQEAAAAA